MTEVDVVETPVGPCAVAVERGRVVQVHMGAHIARDGRRHPLPKVRRWLRDWFAGRPVRVPLQIDASPFYRRIYEVVRAIPRGQTRTYGQVARAAGRPGAARAVGTAMRKNPVCLFIPCHRVVASNGLGGYSGEGGVLLKQRLLEIEGRREYS